MATNIEVTYGKDQSLPAQAVEGRLELVGDGPHEAYVGTDSGWEKITDKDKANTDGFYEQMTVGHALEADQLASDRQIEDADEACTPIVFGPVGGSAEVQDGYSKFTELRGNTVCWNQLVQNGNFANGTNNWYAQNANITVSNGKMIATSTDNSKSYGIRQFLSATIPTGHKIIIEAKSTTTTSFDGNPFVVAGITGTYNTAYNNGIYRDLITLTGDATYFDFRIKGDIQSAVQVGDTITIEYIEIFDLTQLTVEYSTVAAFRQDYPLPYYAHNPGQLLSSKSASLIVRGKNQFQGLDTFTRVLGGEEYEISGISAGGYLQEYDGAKTLIKTSSEITSRTDITLDASTVYVKIQATTYSNIMFYIAYQTYNEPYAAYEQQVVTLPNIELKSAGTARDVAYQTGGGKRRIGSIDLGSIDNWTKISTTFSCAINDAKLNSINAICTAYSYGIGDKHFVMVSGYNVSQKQSIIITDSSYSTAQEFQAAMSGVYLYYELATETDITTEENPGWTELVKIDNFGTLEYTTDPAQTPQVPQAYFIRYTVNLGEWVDSAYVKTNGDPNNIITNTDYATSSKAGVVKVGAGNEGVLMDNNGLLSLNPANKNQIKSGVAFFPTISAYMASTGVFYGLAKAAGANLNGSSAGETAPAADGSTAGVYPADAIQAILKMILPAAPTTDGSYDLVCTVSDGTPTFSWVART